MTQSPNKEALEEIFERQITDCCLWIDCLSRDWENLIQNRIISQLSKLLSMSGSDISGAFVAFNAGEEGELLELTEKAGMTID